MMDFAGKSVVVAGKPATFGRKRLENAIEKQGRQLSEELFAQADPVSANADAQLATPAIRQARVVLPLSLGGPAAADVVELGERGVLLALDRSLPYGTELRVELYSADADATIPYEDAIVVHCLGWLVGCMFVEKSPGRQSVEAGPISAGPDRGRCRPPRTAVARGGCTRARGERRERLAAGCRLAARSLRAVTLDGRRRVSS